MGFYLTEKNPGLSVICLTDGADISSFAALTPSGCCACMLTNKKHNLSTLLVADCRL